MKLEKKSVDGWKWQLKDFSVLAPWFADYSAFIRKNSVKSNKLRTVFKVTGGGKNLYVKYTNPKSLTGKLKARLVPQVKSEFESAVFLEKHSIPHAEYLGWGIKGNEGMLISLELANAVNARDFWFEHAAVNVEKKKLFLLNFSSFLKLFFSSGLLHPDFHIGNLLFKPDSFQFFIVDPYGIKETGVPSPSDIFSMSRIIGALRGELSDTEAMDLIINSGMAEDISRAGKLWPKILKAEAEEIEKLWPKRKLQILKSSSRYAMQIHDGLFIRNSMYGKPFFSPDMLNDEKFIKTTFKLLEIPGEKAEKLWLASFRLQFHRIAHPMPLAWVKSSEAPHILYFSRDLETPCLHAKELAERRKTAGQDALFKNFIDELSIIQRK